MKRFFSEAEVEVTLLSALEDIMDASVNTPGSDLNGEDEDPSKWE